MNNDTKASNNSSTGLIGMLVVFLGLFLFAYTVPLANTAKAAIMETLGLKEEADTSSVFTSYFLAWLIIVPPGAFLADRFGRKNMLMAGSLTLTAGMLLLSVSKTLPMACVAQFLNGAGAIVLQIVGVAIVTDFNAKRQGSNLSLAVGLVGMVALLSPMLMGELLAQGVAWTTVYRVSAILPALAFVAQLFCHFPTPASAQHITLKVIRDLLGSPAFVLLILAMLVYGIIEQGIPIWAPSYLGEELQVSLRWQAVVVSGYFLLMSVARSVVGAFGLFDRFSYLLVAIASAVLGAVCLALGTLPNNSTLGIICLIASGPAIAMIWPSIMTYAVKSTGKPTTTVFGLVVGIGGATGVILGSRLGEIKKLGFSYQQSLLTLEVPFLLLVLIFAYLMLTQRLPSTPAAESSERT